ncbi:DUF7739 domain-containing protein [Nonomuraea dietziae]|uniref:DUF7739 domain-containing protein n=1 Tax=Nonomuraea dietziae TaxID=65515 RepID=UPI0033CC8DC9
MGYNFGPKTGTRSGKTIETFGRKVARKGGVTSTGLSRLLATTQGGQPQELRGRDAEQAARSLREVAPRLRGADRDLAIALAEDAEAASRRGRWTIR